MILNIGKDNRLAFGGETGVKVIIHDWKAIARPRLYGINVPTCKNAIILKQCVVINETSEVGYTDDIELTFLSNVEEYSRFACMIDASIKHIAETCDCMLDQTMALL